MGSSRAVPYTIEIQTTGGFRTTPMEWYIRRRLQRPADGPATVESIDRWVTQYENSLRKGGCNAHLGIHSVTYARIVRQADKVTMAEWVRSEQRKGEPMFQLID